MRSPDLPLKVGSSMTSIRGRKMQGFIEQEIFLQILITLAVGDAFSRFSRLNMFKFDDWFDFLIVFYGFWLFLCFLRYSTEIGRYEDKCRHPLLFLAVSPQARM